MTRASWYVPGSSSSEHDRKKMRKIRYFFFLIIGRKTIWNTLDRLFCCLHLGYKLSMIHPSRTWSDWSDKILELGIGLSTFLSIYNFPLIYPSKVWGQSFKKNIYNIIYLFKDTLNWSKMYNITEYFIYQTNAVLFIRFIYQRILKNSWNP